MGQSLGGARDIKKVKSFDMFVNVHGKLLEIKILVFILKLPTIF